MANFSATSCDKKSKAKKVKIYDSKKLDHAHDKINELADKLERIVKWEKPSKQDNFSTKLIYWLTFLGYGLVSFAIECIKFICSAITIDITFFDFLERVLSYVGIERQISIPRIPWLNDFLSTPISTLPVFELPPHQALRRVFWYSIGGIILIYTIFYFIKYISLKLYQFLVVAKKFFSFICLTIALAAAIIHSFYFFEFTFSYWWETIISFAILMFVVFIVRPQKAIEAIAYSRTAANDDQFIKDLDHAKRSGSTSACRNTHSSNIHIKGANQYSYELLKSIFRYSFIFSLVTILAAIIASWIGCDVVAAVSLALTVPSFATRMVGRFAPMFETFISQICTLIKEHKKNNA